MFSANLKLFLLIFLFFLVNNTILYGQNIYKDFDCYTIAVGKNASKTGNVLVAHNEDDWGDLIVNIFKVPAKDFNSNEKITLLNGTQINQVKHTFSYLWFETTQQKFGDYYLNENGVSICSDACQSKEDTATGNIGFFLRRIIAERANSAKQGVKIAGKIISEIGYESSGRTYCIADANEIWMLSVVKGRHWIAQRVPDTMVAIIPNYYTIQEVNLSDTNNFLASNDIIDYAVKRGWYNPQKNGKFNFREAYSNTGNLYSIANIPRHWQGINMLAKSKVNYNDNFDFSFIPKNKITKQDLQNVLSSHYENTDFETNWKKDKNPHRNIVNRICNAGTKFSTVTEFYTDRPKDNSYIVWWAPLNPCIHPYIPISFGIKNIPEEYSNNALNMAIKEHFNKTKNSFENNDSLAYSIFHKVNNYVNNNYIDNIKSIKDKKTKLEEECKILYFKETIKKDCNTGQLSEQLLKELYNYETKILGEIKNQE